MTEDGGNDYRIRPMMSEEDPRSILERLAARGTETMPRPMTPLRALKYGLVKALEVTLDMEAAVTDLLEEQLALSELSERLTDDELLCILKADDDASGLISIDMELVSSLIEQQTIGRVLPKRAQPRKTTRTDAIMAEATMNELFEQLEELLPADGRGPWFYGYRMGGRISEVRKVVTLLADTDYLTYSIELDIANGARSGRIVLALPADIRMAKSDGSLLMAAEDWSEALSATVLGSKARLDAVLHKFSMTVQDVMSLETGQILPIPGNALASISLNADDGRPVASAALGQAQGMRAVKIQSRANDELSEPPIMEAEHSATREAANKLARISLVDGNEAPGAAAHNSVVQEIDPMSNGAALKPSESLIETD